MLFAHNLGMFNDHHDGRGQLIAIQGHNRLLFLVFFPLLLFRRLDLHFANEFVAFFSCLIGHSNVAVLARMEVGLRKLDVQCETDPFLV